MDVFGINRYLESLVDHAPTGAANTIAQILNVDPSLVSIEYSELRAYYSDGDHRNEARLRIGDRSMAVKEFCEYEIRKMEDSSAYQEQAERRITQHRANKAITSNEGDIVPDIAGILDQKHLKAQQGIQARNATIQRILNSDQQLPEDIRKRERIEHGVELLTTLEVTDVLGSLSVRKRLSQHETIGLAPEEERAVEAALAHWGAGEHGNPRRLTMATEFFLGASEGIAEGVLQRIAREKKTERPKRTSRDAPPPPIAAADNDEPPPFADRFPRIARTHEPPRPERVSRDKPATDDGERAPVVSRILEGGKKERPIALERKEPPVKRIVDEGPTLPRDAERRKTIERGIEFLTTLPVSTEGEKLLVPGLKGRDNKNAVMAALEHFGEKLSGLPTTLDGVYTFTFQGSGAAERITQHIEREKRARQDGLT